METEAAMGNPMKRLQQWSGQDNGGLDLGGGTRDGEKWLHVEYI